MTKKHLADQAAYLWETYNAQRNEIGVIHS